MPRHRAFIRQHAHVVGQRLKLRREETRDAARGNDQRFIGKCGRVTHGLAALCLGLAGDAAGVDHHAGSVLLANQLGARGLELVGHHVKLHAVNAAAEVCEGDL